MKLLRSLRADIFTGFIIFITSVLTVFDWFLTPVRSSNMDGIVHTLTPNLFYGAIKGGEFPVSWVDGFANYGLPLGVIAHQLTTYLTSFFEFLVNDPVIAFNLVAFLGFFLSFLFFYIFLRIYFNEINSFTGGLLFHLSAYRILNIYIRGALPEFFAAVFIPLLLIGLYLALQRKNIYGYFLVAVSVLLISLTHPFMLVIGAFLVGPYFLYLIYENKLWNLSALKQFFSLGAFSLIGLGASGYFIVPLFLEIKYFYYGLSGNHLTPGNFLSLSNYLDPKWYYFTQINILPRGFVVNFGLLETLIVIIGIIFVLLIKVKKIKIKNESLLFFAIITSIVIIFFTSVFSKFIYENINIVGNIQFPWRLFSVLIFLPPIIAAVILEKINSKVLILCLIIIICVLRLPQLYGKNYVKFSEDYYSFTKLNLHAIVMNPIWTGKSEDYPVKSEKAEILEGEGVILEKDINNSTRTYKIKADTTLKMVDYTFYFPGWNLYIDKALAPIEFQDPAQRGVITYQVPPGEHTIELKFEDTRVRMLGKLVSLVSVISLCVLFLSRHKIPIKK